MRLAEYTDYTFRVLMYCAGHPLRLVTIGELAERHGLSKNHLTKIVNDLSHQGLLETRRGRGGGLRLLKDPDRIRVGDVVRACETDFRLVECFDSSTNQCTLSSFCRLKGLFNAALIAYFKELDGATLTDITCPTSAPGPVRSVTMHRRDAVGQVAEPERSRRRPVKAVKRHAS
jgi:Rrf2 family nitric oxide-sensitive transcriptional repressor